MVCLKLPENYQACPGYKAAELGGCVLDLGERALGSSRWWPPPLPNSSFRALTASAEQLPIPDSLFFPMSVHGAVSLAHHGYSGQHLSTRQRWPLFLFTVTQKGSHPDESALILICSLSVNSMMKPDMKGRMNTCLSNVPPLHLFFIIIFIYFCGFSRQSSLAVLELTL
jgi:hypothetical protein